MNLYFQMKKLCYEFSNFVIRSKLQYSLRHEDVFLKILALYIVVKKLYTFSFENTGL